MTLIKANDETTKAVNTGLNDLIASRGHSLKGSIPCVLTKDGDIEIEIPDEEVAEDLNKAVAEQTASQEIKNAAMQ